jgi:hypothetical protein
LGGLDQEAQVVDLVFEIEEVGLELLLGDVPLGVEAHVAVLLGLFRCQATRVNKDKVRAKAAAQSPDSPL